MKIFLILSCNLIVQSLPIIMCIAFMTHLERKILGTVQRRRGPNVIGPFGLLQAFADGIKLFFKETIIPYRANKIFFFIAPILVFTACFLNTLCIPLNMVGLQLLNFNYDILFILSVSSLMVYGIILAGWASNSMYGLLGSIRTAAQLISYEVSFSVILLPSCMLARSYKFTDIVAAQEVSLWFIIPLFPAFVMGCIALMAELNRTPFDLPEAESELVSGYNIEYSALIFALFFLAEYCAIIIGSVLMVICFLGGWNDMFYIFKIITMICLIFLVRATLPRIRFDQLIDLGWKQLLPFSLAFLLYVAAIILLKENL